jgi:hypothetical protein
LNCLSFFLNIFNLNDTEIKIAGENVSKFYHKDIHGEELNLECQDFK